jgi:hypothetical protein
VVSVTNPYGRNLGFVDRQLADAVKKRMSKSGKNVPSNNNQINVIIELPCLKNKVFFVSFKLM